MSDMEAEKLIEKISQEQNESSKVVRIALAYAEFASLVKRMREAQRNYYKDRPKVGYKVAYQNMINKEQLVDEYLKKMEG